MSFYEYLLHEYSFACYLAYIYDFSPYDSVILNNKDQFWHKKSSNFKGRRNEMIEALQR